MAGGQALTGGYLCGVRFELTAVEPEGIARRTRDYDGTGLAERLAQLRDAHLQRSRTRGRQLLAQQQVDRLVSGNDPIDVQHRIARSARWIAPTGVSA